MLKLLNLLKDGRFHSGQALGAALGVSRSAVWKQLQHLEAELNLPIYKVRGRGYQLATPLSLLETAAIAERSVDESWPALIFDSIDSTNAQALREVNEGRVAPLLFWLSGKRPGEAVVGVVGPVRLQRTFITVWYCA